MQQLQDLEWTYESILLTPENEIQSFNYTTSANDGYISQSSTLKDGVYLTEMTKLNFTLSSN